MRPIHRQKSQTYGQKPASESLTQKQQLIAQIRRQQDVLERNAMKIEGYKKQLNHFVESNQRNTKRLIRYRMKFQELHQNRNHPEYFLSICGFMNEYMQEFMLCHDFQVMNVAEQPNPDNMSYEQLLALGESIGKVSKGLPKQHLEKLQRRKNINGEDCPICCTDINRGQEVILLNCKHIYHEECILEWLKDENNCPICKKHVLS